MKKAILLQLLKFYVFGLLLFPLFAHTHTCVEYFYSPTITEISQLSNEQLVSLRDLARLEIEAQSIPNAIIRSNQFNEVNEKLEELVQQSKIDIQLYTQIRLEVWESIKSKTQMLLLQEALRFESQTLSKYRTTNLTEILHQTFLQKDEHVIHTILSNRFLLSKIDINRRELGSNLLHAAILHAKNSELEVLLKLGMDPNAEQWNQTEETVFHKAVKYRDVSTLKLLLKYGAKVDIQNNEGDTPLFSTKNFENMEFLLKKGAKANARNEKGRTPLHHAAWFFGDDVAQAQAQIKLLLQYGADINARDNEGQTALHGVLERSKLSMVDFLKEHGADIEAKDNEGRTPLLYVVEKVLGKKEEEKIQIVEVLLKNGMDINARKNDGRTALHHAIHEVDLKIAEFLIENGADVNARDENGITILHEVSSPNSSSEPSALKLKILDTVIQKGADKNAKTNRGESVLQFAYSGGKHTWIKVLLKHGVDVNIKGFGGQTLLHQAVEDSRSATAEMLIQNKADVNARDDHGKTPLYYVDIFDAGVEIKNLLLQNGAVE